MESFNQPSAFSQNVFINTEADFGNAGGDQLDRFKINFNTQPFEADSDSMLRLSVPQFNLQKNFYDVNATNNAVRVFTSASTDTNATDAIVTIPEGDYPSLNMLVVEFANALRDHFNTNVFKAGTPVGAPTIVSDIHGSVNSTVDTTIAPITQGDFNTYIFEIKLDVSAKLPAQTYGATAPVFQALQIPASGSYTLTGGTVPLTRDEYFNDSYNLLGASRVETFEQTPTTASFTSTLNGAQNILTISGKFSMNQAINTLPYVYLKCEIADNQATKNMTDTEEEHNHEATHSTILAKVPRVRDQGARAGVDVVSYTLEGGLMDFFTNIHSNFINSLIFSVCDHRGRPIPSTGTANAQKREGNMFLDMAVRVDKLKVPSTANILQSGVPPRPDPRLNPSFPISGTIANDPSNLF